MKKELTSLLIKKICKGKTCEKCKYKKNWLLFSRYDRIN